MKPFLYRFIDSGEINIDYQTVTVGELCEALARYPAETPVCGTWEGQLKNIDLAKIELCDPSEWDDLIGLTVLIDVDR